MIPCRTDNRGPSAESYSRQAGEAMLPDELSGPGAVSFAVALLNSWNDREHAAALRASVPPPLPPGG